MSDAEILEENLRPSQRFEEGLAEGKLLYQRCEGCGAVQFYPRVLCSSCGGVHVRFQESAGTGSVYAATAVAAADGAYSVCLVDLDEGFRMMATVVELPADEVEIGMRVVVGFEPTGDEGWRAVFTAAERP
jgi:uncharacterized OB-fold protein